MKKWFALLIVAVLVVIPVGTAFAGFDEYGYNDVAHVFNGTGLSWCLAGGHDVPWCESYLGLSANDKLVMKWNAAWDACNDAGNNDPAVCAGAWTSNQWNGMGPDGSQSVWHYKIIWVGSEGESSPYWLDGGYSIWGNYEVIQDFGFDSSGHHVYAKASPQGYGLGK